MMPDGINICGPVTTTNGIGQALRGFINAVKLSGLPWTLHQYPLERTGWRSSPKRTTPNPHPLNCLYFNASGLADEFWTQYGSAFLQDRHNVGFWYWETDRLRPSWIERHRHCQELWTGSHYCREVFESQLPLPVAVIPPVVEFVAEPEEACPLNIPSDLFVVLCCYDYRSCLERKDPNAVVQAFQRAFPRHNDVRLVLKARTGGLRRWQRRQHRGLQRLASGRWPFYSGGDHRLLFVEEDLSFGQIQALLRRCDCLVSLHHSEGFGLHLAEAMAMEVPVIATGYSGNMDFMREDNSYPVGYELCEVPRGTGPYPSGSHWANPDIDHAAELLQRVYSHRDEARQKGRRGAAFLREHHSSQRVAQIIRQQVARSLEAAAGRPHHYLARSA